MPNFELMHTDGAYRDFEPVVGIEYAGYARITFNDYNHTAYGVLVNPAATVDNDVLTYSNQTKSLSWEEALALVGEAK